MLLVLKMEEEGHEPNNGDSLYKMEKTRKRILPCSLRKAHSSVGSLILAHWDQFQTLDLKNCYMINLPFSAAKFVVIFIASI